MVDIKVISELHEVDEALHHDFDKVAILQYQFADQTTHQMQFWCHLFSYNDGVRNWAEQNGIVAIHPFGGWPCYVFANTTAHDLKKKLETELS